jgi:pre-mRNA-processing factor 17
VPKRAVHTWGGHTKGVAAARLLPATGHLLLTAGLDGLAKVWDASGAAGRRCLRTYAGHGKGLRDASFDADGARFATSGHDKLVRVWDTETGAVRARLGAGQMAYCVRFHGDAAQPDVLMAGTQNKKIVQFDLRSGDAVQEYDYHLGPVNTVTFIDGNRKFISTSDDKTIRVWEFGIPVQVQYIADPAMHAISAAAASPDGKWWVGQSADNSIVTYSAGEKVRQNRKKTLKGHASAGYACGVGFSHDGRYVVSGSGDGKLFVWDWKSGRIARSLRAHEGVCIGAEWHPLESSKVVTCGWDGAAKLWD